jgi:hypothetical protein
MKIHGHGLVLAFILCFAVASAGQGQKSQHATGRVTAIAPDSITVRPGNSTLTFEVTSSTTVVGKGVGTKARGMKAQGKLPVVADLIEQYDVVDVEYHDVGNGKLQATRIDIRAKRSKTEKDD